jgi:hypothetical protein
MVCQQASASEYWLVFHAGTEIFVALCHGCSSWKEKAMTIELEPVVQSLNASFKDQCAAELDRAAHLFQKYELANTWRFPGYRRRHRCLRQLTGVLPITPVIPPWWEVVPWYIDEPLRGLLLSISPDEFYQGCLTAEREEILLRLRASHPEWGLQRSPRITRILQAMLKEGKDHPSYKLFVNRGTKRWKNTALIVSVHPWDLLTFGCGKSYSSCQHLEHGDSNEQLPANLLDSGLAVAYVANLGENRWQPKRMEARVLLRLLQNGQGKRGILIDRFYGDVGYIETMRQHLTRLIRHHGLGVWQPLHYYEHTATRSYEHLLSFDAYGPLQHFQDYPTPYLDQAKHRHGDLCSWIARYRHWNLYHALEAQVVEIAGSLTEKAQPDAHEEDALF